MGAQEQDVHECFHRGAATFMILGNLCTRGCGLCCVPKGNPRVHDMRLDPSEPANVARMHFAASVARPHWSEVMTKSGFMVGRGESGPLVRRSYMAEHVNEQAARA
jgi:lipoate synthase